MVHQSIRIAAPTSTVWKVLTDSAITKQYMYGCEIVSDWGIGSPFNWKGGDGTVYVKGFLVALEPERVLRYSMFDPFGGYEDVVANYLTLSNTLTSVDGGTRLDIESGDFATVANGEARYRDVTAGGDELLVKIKAIAEGVDR
ncbi:MAG TPA: SRPBCC domain-containing protein [Gemmatimonadaceae bacterium]|jgi:uncharacterized protein YndB with AHSA1/START domain|nr:SRPBCC domain-containing protein [Gemmatimonadaceae bacterium]